MITVNGLIINALKAVGIDAEVGTDVDALYTNAALDEMNNLITVLNLDDFIFERRKEVVVRGSNKITIGPDPSYTIQEDCVPINIKALSRKVGLRYTRLIKADKARIYSSSRTGLAYLYTYNIIPDEEKRCMYGEIFTNGGIPAEYLVIYNQSIPKYGFDDELWFSDMPVNLIEEGLKYKLAVRYKMPDAQVFENEFNNYKRLVREANGQNNPMTYDSLCDESYLDGYYNVLGGTYMC